MIKKIKIEQLKPGVFVHDFNSGWLHHPFLHNQLTIRTEREIEKIIKYGIREVYIDTMNGIDVDDAPTKQEVDREIEAKLRLTAASPSDGKYRVPLKKEIRRARALAAEATSIVHCLMDEAKLGKRIDMGEVERIVDRMTASVLNNKDALVSLLRIKDKDEYTYTHCVAVSALCISFSERLGYDPKQIKAVGIGGLLHDIGKVKIPNEILKKPGPLTEREFEIMKKHVYHGHCMLQDATRIEQGSVCVTTHHHERLDGTGYPAGLKGDEISSFGQLAAIVDIYDALTSERCYKHSMPPTEALKKIFEWSSAYLNRDLAEQFIAHLGIYPIGAVVRLESGVIGVVVDRGENGLLYPTVRAVFDTKANKRVDPFDINLSKTPVGGPSDCIVACESAAKYKINFLAHLS